MIYEIVSAQKPFDLAKLVNEKLAAGHILYEGPFVDPSSSNFKFNQAVTKSK